MAEVKWTPQATDDLEATADFIALDSPHYASLFVMDVLAAVKRLRPFPRSGRIVPEANDPDVREIILGNRVSAQGRACRDSPRLSRRQALGPAPTLLRGAANQQLLSRLSDVWAGT